MNESRKAIRIFFSDDHTLFRETLKKVFDSEKDFLVIGEAGDGEETVRAVKQLEPDILLLERQLPKLSGMDVLRSLSDAGTKTRSIVLTAEIGRDQIQEAFRLGARGLVLKESSAQVLVSSIRSVMAGRYWMMGESFLNLDQIANMLTENTPKDIKPKNFSLTPRELKVIAAVISGCTNKEIAKQFSISEQTVKHHITNIFDKLGVFNRLELSLFALHHNLIEDPENQ
jgi:two-component system, NarL family, nitrate/nitrite response regulator NarL